MNFHKIKNYFVKCDGFFDIFNIFSISVIAGVLVICCDCLDLFTRAMNFVGIKLFIMLLAGVISATLFVTVKKATSLIKYPFLNVADVILITLFISATIYLMGAVFAQTVSLYKVFGIVVLLLFDILLVFIRINMVDEGDKTNEREKSVDLKEIYANEIDKEKGTPIIVSDSDVSYDLLERGSIIDTLYSSIIKCNSEKSFVIGFEGDWGSGKTTVINVVKQRIIENNFDTIKIIDDFDPWTYGSAKALLVALFDTILKTSNLKSGFSSGRKAIEEISSSISENYVPASIAKAVFSINGKSEIEKLQEIKKRITSFLESNGLKLVIFVDNFDRASSENVIFMMKIINIVFDIPHIVFVLAYDKNRLYEIMEDSSSINPKYNEKIINQIISIPPIRSDRQKSIIYSCVDNLLVHYGVDKNKLQEYTPIKEYLAARITNLRHFKRIINSVFPPVFSTDTPLHLFDLLSLQIILFEENEVYNAIYSNKRFFVSEDTMYDRDLIHHIRTTEQFNQEAKVFYTDLSAVASPECMNLLGQLFPYVKFFLNGSDMRNEYGSGGYDNRRVINAIRSAKYFELFFSYGNNDFLRTSNDVDNFLDEINNAPEYENVLRAFSSRMKGVSPDVQHEWISQLSIRKDRISPDSRYSFVKVLYECLGELDDSVYFLVLSPRVMAHATLSELIVQCDTANVDDFLSNISDDYGHINDIRCLVYWLKNESKRSNDSTDLIYEKTKNVCEKMSCKIISETIDLYSDDYYSYHNVYGLFSENDEEVCEDFIQYISKVATKNNIIRIIGDIIGVGVGETYSYYISEKTLVSFFRSTEDIDALLVNISPKNESEEFVLQVYDNYKNGDPDVFGHKTVVKSHQVNLDL